MPIELANPDQNLQHPALTQAFEFLSSQAAYELHELCAKGIVTATVSAPGTCGPDGNELPILDVARRVIGGPGGAMVLRDLLVLMAQQAREGDALAVPLVHRIAAHHAAHEVAVMESRGDF
jgi:hypothetical protein